MVTLPHTGLQVPHHRLSVDALVTVDMPNGVAFSAQLILDGRPAGVIANHGDSDATYYLPFPDSLFDNHALTEFATECRTQAGRIPDEKNLLELLIEEQTTGAEIAEAQRRGALLVRHIHPQAGDLAPDHGPPGGVHVCRFRQLPSATRYDTEDERERLVWLLDRWARCDNGIWQIWLNGAWTPLTSTS